MNKKTLAGIGIVMGILIAGIIAITAVQFIPLNEPQKTPVSEIDLMRVADGKYLGAYEEGDWKYLAEVTIVDHQIESVLSYKQPQTISQEKPEEGFIDKIVNALSLRKKGTSITNIAFSKAVQNALAQGIKK